MPTRLSTLGTASLVTLVIQNAAVALITRQSRMTAGASTPSTIYHTSTVILNQEIVKLILCLIFFAHERKVNSLKHYWRDLTQVVVQPDTIKLAVPAALFTLQNFLIFIALANLDVMTFQMLSQTKLLSAAVFTVLIMHRRLTKMQWVSLIVLTLGVILAHVDTRGTVFIAKHLPRFGRGPATPKPQSSQQQAAQAASGVVDFSWLGVLACIVSGLSSSFAGVYFEKVVKTSAPSLAVRNIHLSIFGIPFAILSMLVIDVSQEGWSNFSFFRGYSPIVWLLVATHAIGGLLVAAVVKYADNILKGFATAIATVLSGIYAALFWSFVPTFEFVLGCTAVFASVILFHAYEEKSHDSSHNSSSPTSSNENNDDDDHDAVLIVADKSNSKNSGETPRESPTLVPRKVSTE